jgi:DNA adenine methylase
MASSVKRSPLFYVGDKYKLIEEIRQYFPNHIRKLVEPFVGGGSVFMNVNAEQYFLNDIDKNVIAIHKMLCSYAETPDLFFKYVDKIVKKYGLSCSYKKDIVPDELKKQFIKTYFAKFNKVGFERLRNDYNSSKHRSVQLLYVLMIYGFNRMLRFNKEGNYNLPVGNVDFNSNTIHALSNYFGLVSTKQPCWYNMDFENFVESLKLNEQDLVYLDPPYLITFSEYNKLWNEDVELRMLYMLDRLNERGIKFAVSNVTHYRGKVNELFLNWSQKYNSHPIKSNYISYHDNTTKQSTEVLITNF